MARDGVFNVWDHDIKVKGISVQMEKIVKKGWMRHLDFIVADMAAISLSLLCAFLAASRYSWENSTIVRQLAVLIPLFHLVACILADSYNGILRRSIGGEFVAVCKIEFLIFFMVIFFAYFLAWMTTISQKVLVVYFIFCVPATFLFRLIHKSFLCRRYSNVKYVRQIVVVTTKKAARQMIRHIMESTIKNYQFSGLAIMDETMTGQTIDGVPVSADKDTVIDYMRQNIVDEAFISISDDSARTLKLARDLLEMGVTVHIYMEEAYECLPNRCISNVFGYNVLTSTISPISFSGALLKRMTDIAGGLVGCLLALLIGLVIGPVIYACSPGPILFTQTRVGKHGRPFKIYKFRSMYMDAEERKKELMEKNKLQHDFMFKMDDDPRIIRGIGTLIRRTSLDEFPQFWNVLKGDMSMVGTRPPTMDEYEKYSPHHKRRLSMLPGITGLWQVSGRSSILDFEEVVRLDTEYIENWNLELDIKIILKTIVKIWKDDEAV